MRGLTCRVKLKFGTWQLVLLLLQQSNDYYDIMWLIKQRDRMIDMFMMNNAMRYTTSVFLFWIVILLILYYHNSYQYYSSVNHFKLIYIYRYIAYDQIQVWFVVFGHWWLACYKLIHVLLSYYLIIIYYSNSCSYVTWEVFLWNHLIMMLIEWCHPEWIVANSIFGVCCRINMTR